MPAPPIDGGGGGFDLAYLDVTPLGPYTYGVVSIGNTADVSVTVTNLGGFPLKVTAIGVGGAPYTIVGAPALPTTLGTGLGFTFIVRYTPTAAVLSNDTLTITAMGDNSPFTAALSGTGAGGAVLSATPMLVNFPDTVVTIAAADIIVTLKNTGSIDLSLTAITLTLSAGVFSINSLPAMPLTLHPTDTTTFHVGFTPNSITNFVGNVHCTTAAANNPDIALQGSGVAITPVAILSNNVRSMVFAFSNTVPNVLHKTLNPTNLNGAQASTLIFNGSLWESPGDEKKMRRLQVIYENVGVCPLVVTVTVFRPSLGVDSFDVVTTNLSIGTALADGTERTDFFDLSASGELAELKVTRAANAGPVSLIAFIPHFEDGGPKIEGR